MPTEILAVGTTAAESSDVVVAAGEQATICLKDAAGPKIAANCRAYLQIKDDDGEYFDIEIIPSGKPARVVSAGTWRVRREVGGSCGAFTA